MKSFKKFHEAAIAAPLVGAGVKTLLKVGGAYAAAKGGEKILKDLLGTPSRPKDTDWEKNPKDIIDSQLNADQRRVKQRAKYKDYDAAMKAAKKAKDAGNITNDDYIKKVKDAGKLRGGQGNKGRTAKK